MVGAGPKRKIAGPFVQVTVELSSARAVDIIENKVAAQRMNTNRTIGLGVLVRSSQPVAVTITAEALSR